MKNKVEIQGDWNEIKGKLRQKFSRLTDNDLLFIEGKLDEMIGRLKIRMGKIKKKTD